MAVAKANEGPRGNLLLSALSPAEQRLVLREASTVRLGRQEVIHIPEQRVRYIYFPLDCVVATYGMTRHGATVQYPLVGAEGLVGLGAVLGDDRSVGNAIVACEGLAAQIPVAALRAAIQESRTLRRAVMRYASFRVFQMAQLGMCAAHHPVQQRLARLLLALWTLTGQSSFRLTHEWIGTLVGARREAITVAAQALQDLRAISTSRGSIALASPERLESLVCECYASLKLELLLLKRDIGNSSSDGSHASQTACS